MLIHFDKKDFHLEAFSSELMEDGVTFQLSGNHLMFAYIARRQGDYYIVIRKNDLDAKSRGIVHKNVSFLFLHFLGVPLIQ